MFLIDVMAGQKLYTISYLLLLPYVYLFIYFYLKGEVKMLPAHLLFTSTWQASHEDHMLSDILERKQLKTHRYLPNQC